MERNFKTSHWQVLSPLFRTDNAIKNHFYSTLRRSLRRLNKFLGSKNSTSLMRDIKPSVLSKILDYSVLNNLDRSSLHAEFEGSFPLMQICPPFSSNSPHLNPSKTRNKARASVSMIRSGNT